MTSKSILFIVDDEVEVGEILASLLEEDFTCSVFVDVYKAIQAISATQEPFILITDLEMPQMSGVDLIKKTKELHKNCKIFVSTGHDDFHPKVKEALNLGAIGILTKPYLDLDQLILKLRAA